MHYIFAHIATVVHALFQRWARAGLFISIVIVLLAGTAVALADIAAWRGYAKAAAVALDDAGLAVALKAHVAPDTPDTALNALGADHVNQRWVAFHPVNGPWRAQFTFTEENAVRACLDAKVDTNFIRAIGVSTLPIDLCRIVPALPEPGPSSQ